jgi:hypothetical protein
MFLAYSNIECHWMSYRSVFFPKWTTPDYCTIMRPFLTYCQPTHPSLPSAWARSALTQPAWKNFWLSTTSHCTDHIAACHIAMSISCLVKLLYCYDELLPMFARRLELLRYSCWWNYWLFFSRRLPSWLDFIAITVVRFAVRSCRLYDQSAHTHLLKMK